MTRNIFAPLALAGGVIAFFLRLTQNLTGFDADTGLAVSGHLGGIALCLVFLALGAVLFLLSRNYSTHDERPFPAVFVFDDGAALFLPVAGIFLMGASGAADIAMGMGLVPGAAFGNAQYILGALSLAGAAGVFFTVTACRRSEGAFPSAALLILPVAMVVRLVFTYRTVSTDPTLANYYVELLALTFLTLGFFRLSGFAFGDAKPRSFLLCAPLAAVFSMSAIADLKRLPVPSLALYLGGALTLLGFLLAYTAPHSRERK